MVLGAAGAFGYRRQNRDRILKELEESIGKLGVESPYVKSGIFGASPDACTASLAGFREFVAKMGSQWW